MAQKSEQDKVSVWWYWHTSGSALLPDSHHFIVLPVAVVAVVPASVGHAEARQHDMLFPAHPKGEAVSLHRSLTLSTHLHGSGVVAVVIVVVVVVTVVVVEVVAVVVLDVVHLAYEFGQVCVSASWYNAHTGSDAESSPCSMHGPVLSGPMYPRGLFFA